MPPWKPTAAAFAFHNDRRLTDAEIKTLAAWVDGGTPEGDPKDAPPPAQVHRRLEARQAGPDSDPGDDFHLGASGPDTFRCYVLPTNLTEDKYIVGFEVKPGNPRIVHHTLNYWDITGKARELEQAGEGQGLSRTTATAGRVTRRRWASGSCPARRRAADVPPIGNFGGWAPGPGAAFLPQGTGYLLPEGGRRRAPGPLPPQRQAGEGPAPSSACTSPRSRSSGRTRRIVLGPRNPLFLNIPAGKEDHKIDGTLYLHTDCTMHSVMPHMHLIGKTVKVTMTPPGGEKTTLVEIKEWDYNWQETYWFKEPLKLKAGTQAGDRGDLRQQLQEPEQPTQPAGDWCSSASRRPTRCCSASSG